MKITVAAIAANFGRDLDDAYARIAMLLDDARARGAQLVVLPEATLGGYLANLDGEGDVSLPPALDVDGPEVRRLAELAGDLVVTAGLCESDGARRYNTAVAVTGDGVLGVHRKVHQPLGEGASYAAGDRFEAFDSPVGRLGMLICYDKAFPESARALAVDGAEVVCCMSAWPAARTYSSPDLAADRWTRRFDLFDRARALENQVLWLSANQSGTFGSLRFVASAKVVDAGGDVLASTGTAPGVAYAEVDLAEMLGAARGPMFHLRDRRLDAYSLAAV
jgi:N-carbamoylputrescine amidase